MAPVCRGRRPRRQKSTRLIWNLLTSSMVLPSLHTELLSDPGSPIHIYYFKRNLESSSQNHPLGNHEFPAIDGSWEGTKELAECHRE